MFSYIRGGSSIGPHYAERHKPLRQCNEKYPGIGIYTSIYTIDDFLLPVRICIHYSHGSNQSGSIMLRDMSLSGSQ